MKDVLQELPFGTYSHFLGRDVYKRQLLALYPRFRSWKKVLLATFVMSLTIEVGQVILDLLIDANRVFELDDLWTNTLGGLVALGVYRLLVKLIQTHSKE